MADNQLSFAHTSFQRFEKTTKRAAFLAEMNQIVPWQRLCDVVEPYYPKAGNGRPPLPLERMLRIFFLQQWFTLSDPAAEEAMYDSASMREFVGIDLGNQPAPDETTILNFRHLLERHHLGKKLFEEVNTYLCERGIKVAGGTIVDATIIHAPSSTKNKEKARDPEMRQTKKGNQWYFGMKAHIGIDSTTKIVHTVIATSANVHDSKVLAGLLHGKERRVWGDAAYTGQRDIIRGKSPHARDFTSKRAYRNRPLSDSEIAKNSTKSSIRSRVEHIFGIVKGRFGFRKVRYRGIAKNENILYVLFGLTNLLTMKRRLLRV